MTIALSKNVEVFVGEPIRAGVRPETGTPFSEVPHPFSGHRQRPFATASEPGA